MKFVPSIAALRAFRVKPYVLLVALCALAPFFAIPGLSASLADIAGFFPGLICIALGILLGFAALRTYNPQVIYPPFIQRAFVPGVIFLISAALSLSMRTSLFGFSLESGTFMSFLIALMCAWAGWMFLRGRPALVALVLLFASAALVSAISIALIAIRSFTAHETTLLPTLPDAGFLAGLSGVLAMAFFEFLPYRKRHRILLSLWTTLSLVMLLFVPGSAGELGLFAALLALSAQRLYAYRYNRYSVAMTDTVRRFPMMPLAFTGLSGVELGYSFLSQTRIGFLVPLALAPLTDSLRATAAFFVSDPLRLYFGAGLNMFSYVWNRLATAPAMSSTGLYDLMLSGAGVIGLLVFAYFIVTAFSDSEVRTGFLSDSGSVPMRIATVAAIYGFVAVLLYYPSAPLLSVLFVLLGMVNVDARPRSFYVRSFAIRPSAAGWTLIGASSALLAIVILDMGAVLRYQRGIDLAFTGQLAASQITISSAINMFPQPVYYRALSELEQRQLLAVLADTSLPPEQAKQGVAVLSKAAVDNALSATQQEPYNYVNWIALGNVYADLAALRITGAAEQSDAAFSRALSLAPYNQLALDLRREYAAIRGAAPAPRAQ